MMIFKRKPPVNREELASRIDHTLLKPDAHVDRFVDEWKKTSAYKFRAFVAPLPVIEFLAKNGTYDLPSIRLATVIGFPNGYYSVNAKKMEISIAAETNVSDVDFVPNLIMVKSGKWDTVEEEIRELVKEAKDYGLTTKIILETGYLSKNELLKLSFIALETGVDYLKTSTGFGPRGATVDDIVVLREVAKGKAGIKASGGIRTAIQAVMFIALGADIIGTSSGVSIVEEFSQDTLKLLDFNI